MCPGIEFIVARHEIYIEYHHRAVEAVGSIVPVRAVLSIDEMDCELTGRWQQPEKALDIARRVKAGLTQQIGECLRTSIGIGPNTFIAKTASDLMPESTRRNSNPRYAGYDKRVGFADGYAYLVTTEGSLADLNAKLVGKGHPALPMNRFRPNLVISGTPPFAEDGWKTLRIGEAVLQAAKPCGRCQVTMTDQSTGEVRGPEPLATLSAYRDSREFGQMFGMNFVTLATGRIEVGQAVTVE